MIKKWYFES